MPYFDERSLYSNSIVPEDGTVEIDAEVKGDGTAPEAAEEPTGAADEALDVKPPAAEDREVTAEPAEPVDPPADEADDGSALMDFPACLPGNWNVGKSKRVPTYRKCSELSGWVEQLVPRKATTKGGKKFDKYYLSSDGERFRSIEKARSHAAGVGDEPPAGPENDGDGTETVGTGTVAETRTSARARGRKRRSPSDLDQSATPSSTPSAAVAPARRSARKRRTGAAASTHEGDTPMSALTAAEEEEESPMTVESAGGDEIPKVIVAVKKGSGAAAPLASGEFGLSCLCQSNSSPCIF